MKKKASENTRESLQILIAIKNADTACRLALLCNQKIDSVIRLCETAGSAWEDVGTREFQLVVCGPDLPDAEPCGLIRYARGCMPKAVIIGYSGTTGQRREMLAAGCNVVVTPEKLSVTVSSTLAGMKAPAETKRK